MCHTVSSHLFEHHFSFSRLSTYELDPDRLLHGPDSVEVDVVSHVHIGYLPLHVLYQAVRLFWSLITSWQDFLLISMITLLAMLISKTIVWWWWDQPACIVLAWQNVPPSVHTHPPCGPSQTYHESVWRSLVWPILEGKENLSEDARKSLHCSTPAVGFLSYNPWISTNCLKSQ